MGSVEAVNIGRRIREARVASGMTQVQLAEAAGIYATHLGDIETGRSSFKVEVLLKIVKALNVSADSLLQTAIPQTIGMHSSELEQLLADCTEDEIASIMRIVRELKQSLKEAKQANKK